MADAIDFYNMLTRMNDAELVAYEDEIFTNLVDLTDEFETYLNNKAFEGDGIHAGIIDEMYTNCFLDLLTTRSYAWERKLSIPVRTQSELFLRVQEAKKRSGF